MKPERRVKLPHDVRDLNPTLQSQFATTFTRQESATSAELQPTFTRQESATSADLQPTFARQESVTSAELQPTFTRQGSATSAETQPTLQSNYKLPHHSTASTDQLIDHGAPEPLSITEILDTDKKMTVFPTLTTPMNDEEAIASVDLSHLPTPLADKVRTILRKHVKVLAKSPFDVPKTDLFEADIELNDTLLDKCYSCRHEPIPAHLLEETEQLINNMLRADILCEMDQYSPILNSIMVSRKRPTTTNQRPGLRLLLDGRLLNAATLKLNSSITPLNAVFAHLNNSKYLSVFDCTSAFFSIGVRKDKIPLLSFMFRNRRLALNRLPQGYKSSTYWLEKLLNKALENVDGSLNYADDIMLTSTAGEGEEHHLEMLDRLLANCDRLNIRLNSHKTRLLVSDAVIVGFRFCNGRFEIPTARAESIQNHPLPTTPRRLVSFTCFCRYFAMMVIRFAQVTLPLHRLAQEYKDKRRLVWNDEALKSFADLKEAMANAISIAPIMIGEPIKMSSDASNFALAGLCWQLDPNTKEIRYLGTASRILDKREIRWSTIRKEAASVLLMLHVFDWFLKGAPLITSYCDALSLIWLRNCKNQVPILFRFSQVISCYELELIHISGKENFQSDYLTRSLFPTDMPEEIGMSEATATELFEQLTLPDGYKVNKDILRKYMTDSGLPEIKHSRMKKKATSKAKITTSNNQPTVKKERSIKAPPMRTTGVPEEHKQSHQAFFKGCQPLLTSPVHSSNTSNNIENNYTPYAALNEIRLLFDETEQIDNNNETLPVPLEQIQPLTEVETPGLTPTPPTQPNTDEPPSSTITCHQLNTRILTDGLITVATFRRAQETDDLFGPYLADNKPLPPNWFIEKGILILKKGDADKLMLPANLLDAIIASKHFSLYGCHAPHSTLMLDISRHYWRPNLHELIKQKTRNCTLCNIAKKHSTPHMTLGTKTYPSRLSEWAFDCMGGLPQCNGKSYIFVFVCSLTLYTFLYAASNKTSHQILSAFKQLITAFGPIKSLYSDQDPSIYSTKFKDYCDDRQIKLHSTAPHSAWGNSLCEKTISIIKQTLRTHTLTTGRTWTDLLPEVATALNQRVLVGSRFSPAELLWGSEKPTTELISRDILVKDQDQYVAELSAQIQHKRELYIQRRIHREQQQRTYMNASRRKRHFEKDQIVYYRNLTIAKRETGSALMAPFLGPYIITRIGDNGHTAQIQNVDTGDLRTAHMEHLHPASELTPDNPIPLENHAFTLLRPNKTPAAPIPPNDQTIEQDAPTTSATALPLTSNDENSPPLRRSARIRRQTR